MRNDGKRGKTNSVQEKRKGERRINLKENRQTRRNDKKRLDKIIKNIQANNEKHKRNTKMKDTETQKNKCKR